MFRRLRNYFGAVGYVDDGEVARPLLILILVLVLVVLFLFLLRLRYHDISSIRGVHKLIPFQSVVFDPYIRLQ